MGIGGAVMNVPILKYFGYPIKKAIGSAAAIGFIIALCGAVGFLFTGSLLNAHLPHKIDKTKLQVYFGIFLYVVGTVFVFRYVSL